MPLVAFADSAVGQGLRSNNFSSLFGNGISLSAQQDLPHLILAVVDIMLFFAGAIAVVFVIIGGYFYLTAQGNDEQAEKGKKTLVNAVIGVIVVIMSYAIISVVTNTIST